MNRFFSIAETTTLTLLILLNSIGPLGVLFGPGPGFRGTEKGSVMVLKPFEGQSLDNAHPVFDSAKPGQVDSGQRVFVLKSLKADILFARFASVNFILLLLLVFFKTRIPKSRPSPA